ncbi:2'-5' RNA ligase family protein [Gemmatimonas phototrophica]|uniref:2'-5' RNA ligase family protein n=1 Tax=Gemmatimonas phototrophica TaxID=1379270 RepID=UPI0006A6B961|nr:2'-5' RNA ligase family protein [Gemmatimonas phototrophica]
MPTRSQLSLFVPPNIGADIEAVRRTVDPVQHRLIPAHVTLCREDELTGLSLAELAALVDHVRPGPVTLQFGPPERFGEHGIMLPCFSGTVAFQSLREILLGTRHARSHAPHLTLAHPRNPKAPGNTLKSAATLRDGLSVTFPEVHLIEQVDDAPWVVRGTFPLNMQ